MYTVLEKWNDRQCAGSFGPSTAPSYPFRNQERGYPAFPPAILQNALGQRRRACPERTPIMEKKNVSSAPKQSRPAQKNSRLKKTLLLLLGLVLLIIVGVAAFAVYELGKINQIEAGPYLDPDTVIEEDDNTTGGDSSEDGTGVDPSELEPVSDEELDWGEAGIASQVDGVCNILLIGQDTRTEGKRGRSDSMILLSINKNTQQMTMVSLMRDMYVQIPGYKNNRINAAYSYGGAALLDETIAYNFGIQIDYNVEIDFAGFQDAIDTLGGVDIELYQAEADYLNKNYGWSLISGVNHLNGAQALAYSRIRYVGFYDFERTQRQRTVLTTLFNTMKDQSLSSLLAVYDSIAGDLYTDMNALQILTIATSAYSMIDNGLNSYRIPADGMYKNASINGASVLVIPDWDATRSLLYDYLYSSGD